MNKTLKYALSAVLGLAVLTPTFAQDRFPDVVNPDHWAYEAVTRLHEKKILVGYPDGMFKGPRSATRYEMAVAIYATWRHLQDLIDGLDARLKAVEGMGDLEAMKKAIADLQADMATVKAWRTEIDDLNRLTKELQRELASLGVDVAAMRKSITDLEERVGVLEKRKPAVDIHGDVNFVGFGGYSTSGNPGLGTDTHFFGIGRDGTVGVGADRDLTVLHEAAFNVTGTNEEGPKWGGTVVFTNMTGPGRVNGHPFFDQSSVDILDRFDEGDMENYIQDLWVMFDSSLAGLGFNAQAGRISHSISPYIFMRPDNTPYFTNERWDNGKWMIDGALLGFNFGTAKLNVFAGRTSSQVTSDDNQLQPLSAGRIGVPFPAAGARPVGMSPTQFFDLDRILGANISFPLTQNGSINLAYIWMRDDFGSTVTGNGVNVFGGDIRFNFGGPTLEAGYSKSDVVYNGSSIVDEDNAAWYARLGWNQNRWGVNVGYRMIEPQFAAPGWWGRIGIWWNPADIQGFMADAHFDISDMMRLTASAELYEGTDSMAGGLTSDHNINNYKAGIAYKINNAWDLGLGYEHVEYDFPAPGDKPVERWWNIGFGWTLSNNVGMKLLWQINDYHNGNRANFDVGGRGTYRGGLATAQLSIKY